MKTRILLLIPLLAALAAPVYALSRVSPDEAAAIARRESAGRVLAVEKSSSGGREVYRVKVLTPNGEVRVILIDAETGNKL
jgi:uncharacterized membrane protein YkoI